MFLQRAIALRENMNCGNQSFFSFLMALNRISGLRYGALRLALQFKPLVHCLKGILKRLFRSIPVRHATLKIGNVSNVPPTFIIVKGPNENVVFHFPMPLFSCSFRCASAYLVKFRM